MKCINNYEQLEAADPETLKFHSTFKAIARMLIKYLPFSQIDEEKYAARLVGNSLIIYKIIKEWQENDTRTHRKNVLTKPLLIGLFTYAFDSDFREVFNFMFWRLLQLQNEFFIPPAHKDPSTWTNDEGKRSAQGAKVPHEVIVRRTSQSIVLTGALPPRLYWIESGVSTTPPTRTSRSGSGMGGHTRSSPPGRPRRSSGRRRSWGTFYKFQIPV